MASMLLETNTTNTYETYENDPSHVERILEERFNVYWEKISPTILPEGASNERTEEMRQESFRKELAFFGKVYDAAKTMDEWHEGPVTLLFDVDNTLVEQEKYDKNEYEPGQPLRYVVRPAFALVVQTLAQELNNKLEIGLITSRSPGEWDEGKLPDYLDEVKEFVNRDFLLSSRKIDMTWDSRLYTNDSPEDRKRKHNAVENIVEPLLPQDILDQNQSPAWYDGKLAIVQQTAAKNPNTAFVCVDDQAWPMVIKQGHNQVVGVCVYTEMQNKRATIPQQNHRDATDALARTSIKAAL